MSKEKLLDSFDKEFPYVISGKIIDNENGAILFHEKTNLIKLFLSQAIDQIREETLKELIREYQDNELDGKGYDFYFSIRARIDELNKLNK